MFAAADSKTGFAPFRVQFGWKMPAAQGMVGPEPLKEFTMFVYFKV